MKFKCDCGFTVDMKPEEFPLRCKCGKKHFGPIQPADNSGQDKLIQQTNDAPAIITNTSLDDVTACITTFMRKHCLERLLESIKKYYPDLKILVQDTGGNLSWGRNELVKKCTTKYCLILEDDFEFVDDTKLEILISFLEHDDSLGLVGGELNDKGNEDRFNGRHMHLFRGSIEYVLPHNPHWYFVNHKRYRYCDFISNFFLAYKNVLLNNPWDEELRLLEHIPWFWTLKQRGQYKVAYTCDVKIYHHRDRDDKQYSHIRYDLVGLNEKIQAKYGISNSKILNKKPSFKNLNKCQDNVYSLWIGDTLPRLQHLCIKSWLQQGYNYKLFVYSNVKNIPKNVDVIDGGSFIADIYTYQDIDHLGNPALQANYFRYKWLYTYGGNWVDIDTACLHRLSNEDIILSSEPVRFEPYWHPNVAFTRMPIKHVLMRQCTYYCEKQIQEGHLERGFFGPKLIKHCIQENNMEHMVSMPERFCPYPFWLTEDIYRSHSLPVPTKSDCIHLWNNSCVKYDIDVRQKFNINSMYERLWKYLGL